jgi:hypothetical protein
MHRKIKLFAGFSVLLLTTMCTFYDQGGAVISSNGLSCQSRTDFGFFQRQRSAQCYYQCPNGTVRQPEIAGEFSTSSPLYSASKEDLDVQFCKGALQPPPTASPTLPVSATAAPASTESEQISPSATAEISEPVQPVQPVQPPLLAGDVTMCNMDLDLINFRMNDPVPDLTGRALAVQIAEQETTCTINPVNTSVLTCTIPAAVTFPIRVVVHLDGAVVNDFTFNGLGCAKITTVTTAP